MQYDLYKLVNAKPSEQYTASEHIGGGINIRNADYYAVKRLSSSDFDLAKALIEGKKIQIKDPNLPAFVWGRRFHEAVLEPQKVDFAKETIDILTAVKSFNNSPYSELIASCLKEVEYYFFQDELPCKAKMDAIDPKNGVLYDLKTTNCEDLDCMIKSLVKYNYDRQMAFYLDALQLKQCNILFYSKKNFKFYRVGLSEKAIEFGRAKYKSILQALKEKQLFDKIMEIKYGT